MDVFKHIRFITDYTCSQEEQLAAFTRLLDRKAILLDHVEELDFSVKLEEEIVEEESEDDRDESGRDDEDDDDDGEEESEHCEPDENGEDYQDSREGEGQLDDVFVDALEDLSLDFPPLNHHLHYVFAVFMGFLFSHTLATSLSYSKRQSNTKKQPQTTMSTQLALRGGDVIRAVTTRERVVVSSWTGEKGITEHLAVLFGRRGTGTTLFSTRVN